MANTYSQIYIQAVWAVKYRAAVIEKSWQSELFAVIGNIINDQGCKTFIVNGVQDHIHCFFGLKPAVSVSSLMKNVKGLSSKWINQSGFCNSHFDWQVGYGAFSYAHSQRDHVYKYVQNQEAHHRKQTLRQEYLKMLQKFEVPYDERYLFHELI